MRLDHSPGQTPLYRQIADSLAYRIATGKLVAGERLPSLRDAAGEWEVNLHTVRRAYQELSAQGLVEIRGAAGTRVVETPTRASASSKLDVFLARTLEEARAEHGLGRRELAARLGDWRASGQAEDPEVWVVECSESQCRQHAAELERRWRVSARPWPLDRDGEPEGPIVATYFHYNDLRKRWPHRLAKIRFVAIEPDPTLLDQLGSSGQASRRLRLVELDEAKARNIVADLSVLLPEPAWQIEPVVSPDPAQTLREPDDRPILFPPRVWAELGPEERADPRAFEVRYRLTPEELRSVGEHFDWTSR